MRDDHTMKRWIVTVGFTASLMVGLAFAQGAKAEKSLYDRLGGQPAIQAVASGLVDRILADNRINKWFAHASSTPENTKAYKANLTAFICQAVGGPCKYTGKDMEAAHKGRGVTSDAFNAVAEDLSAQLDALKVPAKEKKEVLDLVGSLKPSIVQAPASK
jgi:hemoglobin